MKIIYFIFILGLLITGCSTSKTSNLILNNKTNNKATSTINVPEDKESTSTPIMDYFFSEVEKTRENFLSSLKKDAKEKFEFKKIYEYAQNGKYYEYPEFNSGEYVVKTVSYGDWESATGTAYYEIKILKDKKIIHSKKIDDGKVTGIFQVNYGQNNYYNLIQDWTGGAHCCFTLKTIATNKKESIFGNTVDMANTDVLSQDNFFVKNGVLYLVTFDERFAYFSSSYAVSTAMFIPVINKVSTDGSIASAVDEYKQLYKNSADSASVAIDNFKKQNQGDILLEAATLSSPNYSANTVKKEVVLPRIMFWLENSLLSGEDKNVVWQKFDEYYTYFFGDKDLIDMKKQIEDVFKNGSGY